MEYILNQKSSFSRRHIGPSDQEVEQMLSFLSLETIEELIKKTVPQSIRYSQDLKLAEAQDEHQTLAELREKALLNKILKSYIGTGYYGTITPSVIQRNILENPGWYTQYTPYQAEIAQGRLEALLNFQTMVMDLTGFDIANASMLDEATSAAEAMTLALRVSRSESNSIFVSQNCHPQTIAVVKTRAEALGINVIVGSHEDFQFDPSVFAVLVQYPDTYGNVFDFSDFAKRAHDNNALVIVAADLLALTLLTPPGEWGADVAVGNTQRFGVPFGFGGPHAAYMATKSEYKRQMPGRFVGVSKDSRGKPALRLALQTREQHIRRDRATSNICTAQVLLAIMASMYAVYHGPQGLREIALRVNWLTSVMKEGLKKLNFKVSTISHFDTLTIETGDQHAGHILERAENGGYNLRLINDNLVGLSFDETTTLSDVERLLQVFAVDSSLNYDVEELARQTSSHIPQGLQRKSEYLRHPIFNSYHSETEMQRYMQRLQARDLSLTTSMIPLGSCTMKLNSAVQMIPVTWHGWSQLHPFAPEKQALGYLKLIRELESMLAEITGFSAISMQPNAGSQGEYTGLLTIRAYHKSRGEDHRNICLIPQSAHGTNPASAVMAGMKVVVVACDENGNIDVSDLRAKAEKHAHELAALMVTYPSTHGVFEEEIVEICSLVHKYGGQVYMDGANMNAQVGLCRPADYGADVLHLNLHKTFCIPHGGGGPGMGPIGVKEHLVPFLPTHPIVKSEVLYKNNSDPLHTKAVASQSIGTVSAATWGSPNILVIPWAYIRAMGAKGLKKATEVAILNANYIAKKLEPYYPVLYKGKNGFVAHECIIDLRPIKDETGVGVEDVAKRLMDYGFHAPTISFPVIGTMMIEPTESESKAELDRFCDAMIAIKKEIDAIKNKEIALEDSPLIHAPHTMDMVVSTEWNKKYTREEAAFPAPWLGQHKFWPSVARVDNAYGDKNLICACPPMEAYES